MKRALIYFIPLFLLLSAGILFARNYHISSTNAYDVLGLWLTPDGKVKIQIFRSGDKYYGKLAWLKIPRYENGHEKVDLNNPDPKLRARPLLGLIFMKDFIYDADDNEWDDGYIYDPESGKTYSSYMTLQEEDVLEVRGYIGLSMIGRSQVWTRTE